MIKDDSRYYSLGGAVSPGGPSTWHVIDWDQRRVVSVTMDGEQEDESLAIEHFSRYSGELSLGTYRVYISSNGEIISKYTDPKEDPTYYVYYPSLCDISLPAGIQTMRRDELEELDRLSPQADLAAYAPCTGASARKVVFKYYFMWQYAFRSWREMDLWMRLPPHPNIVPFDRVVVDELEGRVVGFTSIYVPGGNLEENKSRLLKLEWLRQLINAVDDLNLQHGIAHQDVAPRNLLVDELTDTIMLFDFDWAARIHHPSPDKQEFFTDDRNDIKGVIFTTYEIITRDYGPRSIPFEDQNLNDLDLEWVKHPETKLDHPVASYQLMLQEWQERRAGDLDAIQPGQVPAPIDWPSRPRLPEQRIPCMDEHGQPSSFTVDGWYEMWHEVRDRGGKGLNWERPPQRLIDSGTRVLCSGQVINC